MPVWAGLMVLLGITLGAAYIPLGPFNLVLALGIAVAKATLVVVFFMQLRRPDPLLRLAAATALIFVAFMALLTFSDVLVRIVPTSAELKLGVVTALIGVPFFLAMIFSERRSLEGAPP
jgi:cytochrome c oxidase subunit 4